VVRGFVCARARLSLHGCQTAPTMATTDTWISAARCSARVRGTVNVVHACNLRFTFQRSDAVYALALANRPIPVETKENVPLAIDRWERAMVGS
jgi:hypothetical protein